MGQYDSLVIKSGIPTIIGVDTLRADRGAHAELTTTGLASGDAVQVSGALTLGKASIASVSPIIGVYDGVSGSVVKEGVVVATFSGSCPAAGSAVYLSSTAGQLTGTKPTSGVIHEVGVVVDASTSKILLQQKPCIATGIAPPMSRFLIAGSQSPGTKRVDAYNMTTGTWERLADLPSTGKYSGIGNGAGPSEMQLFPGQRKIGWPGGQPEFTQQRQNDELFVYDINTNTWSVFTHTTFWNDVSKGVITGQGRYLIPAWASGGPAPTIYNPSTNTISSAAIPHMRLGDCSSCALADGRVIVTSPDYANGATDIFTDDGGSGSWAVGPTTPDPYPYHRQGPLLRLNDDRIMIVGGWTTACLLNTPACDTAWGSAASIPGGDGSAPGACLLPDGRVVCVSGWWASQGRNIDVYTPGAWSPGQAPALNPGTWTRATSVLPLGCRESTMFYSAASGTGKVYIINREEETSLIQVWDPVADSLSTITPPTWEQRLALGCLF